LFNQPTLALFQVRPGTNKFMSGDCWSRTVYMPYVYTLQSNSVKAIS